MTQQYIKDNIDQASKVIGKTWPLYAFVTSNPLSGYENTPFINAVKEAKKYLNAKVFPDVSVYRKALENGEIDKKEIQKLLLEYGFKNSPDYYLKQLEAVKRHNPGNKNHVLDRMMSKWLAAFMDEGLAEWEMPNKNKGFYTALRQLAKYDREIGLKSINEIPESCEQALLLVLNEYPKAEYKNIFIQHLAALPGWVGYIKHRIESNSVWQKEYPITLYEYLAVRLWIAKKLNLEILSTESTIEENLSLLNLQYIWLKAWENSLQNMLVRSLEKETEYEMPEIDSNFTFDAQMVFCIDTRSELIRRHIESKGHYETYGYAGFFGIAMDYENMNDGLSRKSCPPILASSYKTSEVSQPNKADKLLVYKKKTERFKFKDYFLKRMKNMLPSAFGYVEGSGFFYGIHLVVRTILPGFLYKSKQKNHVGFESICEPQINKIKESNIQNESIPLNEKVAIVKSAFDLMGWKQFAPLVLFIGHGSHSANNPFGSSLDCGACAASPGRHNARMLARLANTPEVRMALINDYDIKIPENTFFIGGEHNTTTDEIVLFDFNVPASHQQLLQNLKKDLVKAQQTATEERLNSDTNSIALAYKKANSWSETRPEWGLAKNAGFIIGPRKLTENSNLEGRCFLHSYDWKLDESGKSLEAIMQGPMVVTQWINNHYYFSTVDNEVFGGGSKITHNITGKFGVVQGNGGDLKMGLPLQSLNLTDNNFYHQPLRLSVFIQAPIKIVMEILLRNEQLKTLLDNEWIYLLVIDPIQNNGIKKYNKDGEWVSVRGNINVPLNNKEKVKEKVLEEVLV